MKYKKACEILDIDQSIHITLDILKKQYRLKALLYHPDKNPSHDASSKFQEIHESYEFLMKQNGYMDDNLHDENCDGDQDDNKCDYQRILFSFFKNILKGESRNNLFYVILKRVFTTCEITAFDTLEKLDKNTLIKIYDIIKVYRDSLHISEGYINKIESIIANKSKNDECIILNPTIDDLFENNLYKLTVNEYTYIVPLWHNELVYDNSGNDLYVKCYPMLQENIKIDDKNNIHIDIEYKISDLWGKSVIHVHIGKKIFSINPALLKLSDRQTIIFAKQGISIINVNDIYDIKNCSDVHIHIGIAL